MGGFDGWSGQYVYQLEREGSGHRASAETYRPLRVVDLRTLTIIECLVALHGVEKDSEVTGHFLPARTGMPSQLGMREIEETTAGRRA